MKRTQPRSKVSGLLIMACLSVAAISVTAQQAQAQQKGELDEATTQQMLEYIRQANEFYDASNWGEAIELYKKAYALSPKPALLYRMGKASENKGDLRAAIGYYEQFVAALPDNDTARKVALSLPELKAKIPPTLAITSKPSNANVYIGSFEGSPVGSTPYEGEFAPGEVTVLVRADGYEPYTRTYTFEGAEEEVLEVTLVKKAVVATGQEIQAPVVEEPGSGKKLKAIGWTSTGLGLAMLGAGGVMSTLQMRATQQVNDYDRQGASDPAAGRREISELKDDANAYWRNAVIFYSVGSVLTAAGVGLVILGKSKDAQSDAAQNTNLTLQFGAAPGAGAHLGLSGSF